MTVLWQQMNWYGRRIFRGLEILYITWISGTERILGSMGYGGLPGGRFGRLPQVDDFNTWGQLEELRIGFAENDIGKHKILNAEPWILSLAD